MWQLDRAVFEPLLGASHELVLELLAWAERHHQPGGVPARLYLVAKSATPPRLGHVAAATNLYRHMAELACSPHLAAIKQDYEQTTRDYKAFFESGAPVTLSEEARNAAKPLFEYLYDDLLDTRCFWHEYVGRLPDPPSKQGFRKQAIEYRTICPYCDFTKSIVPQQTDTDHLLAKSHFPALAVYWQNLIVSCKACNESIKGSAFIGTEKGRPSNVPLFHPHLHQAADHLQFTFAHDGRPAGPHPVGNGVDRQRGENFVRLFKLADMYPHLQPDMKRLIDEFLSKVADKYRLKKAANGSVSPAELRTLWRNAAKHYATGAEAAQGEREYAKLVHDLYSHLEQHLDDYIGELMLDGNPVEDDW